MSANLYLPHQDSRDLRSSQIISRQTVTQNTVIPAPKVPNGLWQSSFDEKLAAVVGKSLTRQQAAIREIATREPLLTEAVVTAELVHRLLKRAGHLSLERREAIIAQVLVLDPALDRGNVVTKLNQLALNSLPAWVNADFWSREIDPILLVGIENANQEFKAALGRIQTLYPGLLRSQIQQRHACYRAGNRGTPGMPFEGDWPPKADCMLRQAVALEVKAEEEAIQRALLRRKDYAVRPDAIKKRLKILRKRLADTRRQNRFPQSTVSESTLPDASSDNHRRRPHKQGKPWDGADLQYLLYHVKHQAVANIAKALGRSYKSVSRKLEDFGLGTAVSRDSLGIYSLRELRQGLHVRHSTLLRWIAEGKLQVAITQKTVKKGHQQHVKEEDLLRFLENHLDEIDLKQIHLVGSTPAHPAGSTESTKVDRMADIQALIDEVLARRVVAEKRHVANA